MFDVISEVPVQQPEPVTSPEPLAGERKEVTTTFNNVFKKFSESELVTTLKNKDMSGEQITPDEQAQLIGIYLMESAIKKVTGVQTLELSSDAAVTFDTNFTDNITGQTHTRKEGIPIQRLLAFLDAQIEMAKTAGVQAQVDELTKDKGILENNSKPIDVSTDPQEQHAWVQQKVAESSEWGTKLSAEADFPILLDQELQKSRVLTLPDVSAQPIIPEVTQPVTVDQQTPPAENKIDLQSSVDVQKRVDAIAKTKAWELFKKEYAPLVTGLVPESLPKVEEAVAPVTPQTPVTNEVNPVVAQTPAGVVV